MEKTVSEKNATRRAKWATSFLKTNGVPVEGFLPQTDQKDAVINLFDSGDSKLNVQFKMDGNLYLNEISKRTGRKKTNTIDRKDSVKKLLPIIQSFIPRKNRSKVKRDKVTVSEFKNEIRKPRSIPGNVAIQRYNRKIKKYVITFNDNILCKFKDFQKGHVRFWRSLTADKLGLDILYILNRNNSIEYVYRKSDDKVIWSKDLEILVKANRKEKS